VWCGGKVVSKGPEAFRTISEVAQELDLPQHVLRFWETRFAQIKPMKRGGGRRYYRPDDIDLLRGIRHLLYGEGYTIRGVQRILREQGPRFVISAGRGEIQALMASQAQEEALSAEEPDFADTAVLDEINGEEGQIEPTFDPREFRAIPDVGNGSGSRGGKPSAEKLTNDEVRRLQTALSELLELKRLLDQAR
jgi:DNA-binding transcriptional MerR regulator